MPESTRTIVPSLSCTPVMLTLETRRPQSDSPTPTTRVLPLELTIAYDRRPTSTPTTLSLAELVGATPAGAVGWPMPATGAKIGTAPALGAAVAASSAGASAE